MTSPTVAPSGLYPEHSCWNGELWGSPRSPGLSVLPQPGPCQPWNLLHEATEAAQYQRETRNHEATAPTSSPKALRDSELPKGHPSPPHCPKRGVCSTSSSDTAPAAQSWGCQGLHLPGPVPPEGWGCTVPAGALPEPRYLQHSTPGRRGEGGMDGTAGPGAVFLPSVRFLP